ncbi:MAG: hypothetical protein KJ941_06555 [Bacteroidetes bacterium]|nr:hypothetical protein [Bacteroidota bacterium]
MKYATIGIIIFSFAVIIGCKKDKVPEPKMEPVEVVCTDSISFQQKVMPLIQNKCFSCHANGTQPVINDYTTIVSQADLMLKTMRGDGVSLMPQGGPALPEMDIKDFNCWIKQGKLNN